MQARRPLVPLRRGHAHAGGRSNAESETPLLCRALHTRLARRRGRPRAAVSRVAESRQASGE